MLYSAFWSNRSAELTAKRIIPFLIERMHMDIQQILIDLNRDRDRLDQAIAALDGLCSRPASRRGRPPGAKQAKSAATRKTGGITAAGRRRLSEMMKKRWAERKKKAGTKSKTLR